MLRTGLILLTTSTAGVLFRVADVAYSDVPGLQWVCLAGLIGSLISFAVDYLKSELPYITRPVQRTSAVAVTAWKVQAQH